MKNLSASELRIGNRVALPVIGSHASVTGLSAAGITIDLNDVDLDPGQEDFEIGEVYGIPITGDHLLALGFRRDMWGKFSLDLHRRTLSIVPCDNEDKDEMDWLCEMSEYDEDVMDICWVECVHEVQNLHAALNIRGGCDPLVYDPNRDMELLG